MGVHNLPDGLRKQHQFCWNQIVPVTVPAKHLNVAGTSPEQVIGTSPEQHGVYAAQLNIGFLEVAKVAIALSLQIARPMTHTQAGMRPQRPMQAMDTDNWDHSPSAHG